jgi:hypothetical protein
MTTVNAQLRRLYSPDVFDLKRYTPDDPESFCIVVQAMVGPDHGPGEESFGFVVCTPRWLSTKMSTEAKATMFAPHCLFMLRYDYQEVLNAIQQLCDQANGTDWGAVAAFLGRYGGSESEDYAP